MLKGVEALNFLSWQNLEVEFTSGITLIDGWNADDGTSEGSGKSAILNAIMWGAYGKLPKEANIDDVIKHGAKKCVVRVNFKDFSVVRSRKPNDLFIQHNGDIIRGKDAKETQILIEKKIGLSFDTFCQSIYFAQNYPNKFLTANQELKAKILSGVLDLNALDLGMDEAKNLKDEASKKAQELEVKIAKLHSEVKDLAAKSDLQRQAIQHKTEVYEISQNHKKSKIIELSNQIEELNIKIQDLESLNKELPNTQEVDLLSTQLKQVIKCLKQLDSEEREILALTLEKERCAKNRAWYLEELKDLKIKLEDLEHKDSNCPTCGKDGFKPNLVDVDIKKQKFISRVIALGKELEQCDQIISAEVKPLSDVQNELKSLKAKQISLETQVKLQEKSLNEFHYNARLLQQLTSDKEKKGNDLDNLVKELKESSLDLGPEKAKLLDLKQQENSKLALLESDSTKLSDINNKVIQFTNIRSAFKEAKTFMFESTLQSLEHTANSYLSELFNVEATISFTNEEGKINTKVILAGEELSLGLLSGGQFRRFALATDLALSKLVCETKGMDLNLLVLDEYFKDLSEESMQKCLEVLTRLDRPVVLIEHNSMFKSIVNNTINVMLKEGTSCISN